MLLSTIERHKSASVRHARQRGLLARPAAAHARYLRSSHTLATPGSHLLRISMVDPGIVLQKVIVSGARLPESYFGPPEIKPVE